MKRTVARSFLVLFAAVLIVLWVLVLGVFAYGLITGDFNAWLVAGIAAICCALVWAIQNA